MAPVVLIQEVGPSGPPGSIEQDPIVVDASPSALLLAGGDRRQQYWPDQVYYLQTDDTGHGRPVAGEHRCAQPASLPDEVRAV